jgi:glycosyltransferase involved in cell wall biosynthesis
MLNNVKISICIPIYNGEYTIEGTLKSILSDLSGNEDKFEIIISDNCSTDNTFNILSNYIKKYEFIKYFKNESNLGFDRNIDKIINLASTDYVWFVGDDDELEKGAVKKVLDILKNYKNLKSICINYSIYDRIKEKYIMEKVIGIDQDILFKNPNDFLSKLGYHPNFVSSLIINKANYKSDLYKKYFDTYWFHYFVLYDIIKEGKSYFISHPFVINKGYEPDGPNDANEGGMSVRVFLRLLNYIFNLDEKYYKESVKNKIINNSVFFLAKKVSSARRLGLTVNKEIIEKMVQLFKKNIFLYVLVIPVYFAPIFIHKLIYKLYKKIK